MDIIDIYRVFHPTTMQYTFFLATHETFPKIHHILVCKANLDKFKKIEVTPCIISDNSGIRLELRNKRN
jgi:hypothetical protein